MKCCAALLGVMVLAGLQGQTPYFKSRKVQERHTAWRPDSIMHLGAGTHTIIAFLKNTDLESQVVALKERGVKNVSSLTSHGLIAYSEVPLLLDGLPVEWASSIDPSWKVSDALPQDDNSSFVLAEFHADVDPSRARSLAVRAGLTIREHPDLLDHHLLVRGSAQQIRQLTEFDETAYVFPAAKPLMEGGRVHACSGGESAAERAGQYIELVGEGWDGPGRGSADLTYAFRNMTKKLRPEVARAEIERALRTWSDVVRVDFKETNQIGLPRSIDFVFGEYEHGDLTPFDGPGRVYGHAFPPFFAMVGEPLSGDICFDESEAWTVVHQPELYSVALHEIGHALGVGHSDRLEDVMYPYAFDVRDSLSRNDVLAVRQLYAERGGAYPPVPLPLSIDISRVSSPIDLAVIPLQGTVTGGVGRVRVMWRLKYAGIGFVDVRPESGPREWSFPAIGLQLVS